MRIRIKPQLIMLFFIMTICADYYYLVDKSYYIFLPVLSMENIAIAISFIWGICLCFKTFNLRDYHYMYSREMIGILIMTVLSSIQANILYNQNISAGIISQRFIILWALLYFPISKYLCYGKINLTDIKKIITIVGTIELAVFIIQYFMANRVIFTYVLTAKRYGEYRFYFSPIILDLLFFFKLDDFFKKDGKISQRINSLIYIALIIFEVMVVQKYRLTTIGLILMAGLALCMMKQSIQHKAIYWIVGIIGAYCLYHTTLVQDVIHEVFQGRTYTGGKSTLVVREVGRTLYINTFLKHPIFGGGYARSDNYLAVIASGRLQRIFFSDNGLFGLLFIYGGVGIAWFFLLWIRMIIHGYKIYKRSDCLTYLLFPLYFLVTGINEAHWYWSDGFMILVIFIVLQREELVNSS